MGLFSRKKSKDVPAAQPAAPVGRPAITPQTRPVSALPPYRPAQAPPPQYRASPPSHGTIAQHAPPPPPLTFQPVGYLPPPPDWSTETPPPAYPHRVPRRPVQQQAPIVVNQHYYLVQGPQPDQPRPAPVASNNSLANLFVGSAVNLTAKVLPGVSPALLADGAQCGSKMLDSPCSVTYGMYERFNDLMTLIDRDKYCGNEKDLFIYQPQTSTSSPATEDSGRGKLVGKPRKDQLAKRDSRGQLPPTVSSTTSSSYFSKVELYANARLPNDLPPFRLYIPTWPLVCLAARYAERVYDRPRGKEKDVHLDSDSRAGTKAMVIKSVPMDDMNTIVFAIRGTASFSDWTVNLNTEPISPVGFLDDYGNYCHAGFLSVARRMVAPVAARLRQLLQEDPSRRSSSLLITGHSAGGAVAALLYAHMHATSTAARSELNSLTSSFKRIHCVTFGTPPVSLLPLQKPPTPELRKSMFLSFINEGDPVTRADKAYVKSLLELFAKPVPCLAARTLANMAMEKTNKSASTSIPDAKKSKSRSSVMLTKPNKQANRTSHVPRTNKSNDDDRGPPPPPKGPEWKVPPCTLSNAGRVIVLRSGDPKSRLKGKKTVEERLNEGVVAQVATDEQLRTQIWGDPVAHLMKLYAGRLEVLAVNAVMARDN
ncbi:Alpha/Beta hydrolase protein [Coniella lustricola]|uniref:Alpha/Beta hydrolase protein n=1 Tax=Coniella lustricola TaxID=2025994 RepID=A0A2T3A979_9PEZI|nr:Alpha/Beta hydrolase protein [Coniella lustricola]